MWSVERVLDVAAHISDPDHREVLYATLLDTGKDKLTRAQRSDAQRAGLVAARAIEDEAKRARALEALAPHLSGTQLGEALAAARGSREKRNARTRWRRWRRY